MDELPSGALLYTDQAILVVDKPAGLPTLVDGYHPEAAHLVGMLNQTYGRIWTVHRLDKETSGVIVFARTAEAHRRLNTQFERRQATKKYHALVYGVPSWSDRSVDLPLLVDGDRRHRSLIDQEKGKPAQTDLGVLERFEGYTLVEAVPHTGRTHQIRAHLSAVGYPLVGDRLYTSSQLAAGLKPMGIVVRDWGSLIKRLALHAHSLSFNHPVNEERMELQAPYPPDFATALRKLRRGLLDSR